MDQLIKRMVWASLVLLLYWYPARVGAQPVMLDRFEVEIDFKEEGYYRSIPFIALHGDLFFITDNFSHRVLEYRFGGNTLEFLCAIGRPGQGPGDLMRPMDISIAADILAVKDESGISFFDLNGVFKNKFQLQSRAQTMLFTGNEVYAITYDAAKPDLIQVYSRGGEARKPFQKKKALYPIRPEIHKGLSPDQLERIVFEGLLRSDGRSVYFLSKRFGRVLRYSPDGNITGNWELSAILGANEKAKAEKNRQMFLEEGFDLEKNQRMIPHNYLFDDAHIVGGRLYLLLENYDLLEKKVKPVIEFTEIDLNTMAVVGTFKADAQAKWESAATFVFIGSKADPVFLAAVRRPGEDEKICVFRPRESER